MLCSFLPSFFTYIICFSSLLLLVLLVFLCFSFVFVVFFFMFVWLSAVRKTEWNTFDYCFKWTAPRLKEEKRERDIQNGNRNKITNIVKVRRRERERERAKNTCSGTFEFIVIQMLSLSICLRSAFNDYYVLCSQIKCAATVFNLYDPFYFLRCKY